MTLRRLEGSLRGYRADQILTSDAFDLATARDPGTEKMILDYSHLAVRDDKDLSEEQRNRREALAKELGVRLPNPHERDEARKAYDAIQEGIENNLRKLGATEKAKVMEEVKLQ